MGSIPPLDDGKEAKYGGLTKAQYFLKQANQDEADRKAAEAAATNNDKTLLLENAPSTSPGSPKPAITLANHLAELDSPQEPSSEGPWLQAAKKGNKKKSRKSRNKKKAATPATSGNVKTFLNQACNVLSPARYSKEDTSSASSQSKAESTSSNLTSTSNTDLDHTGNQEQKQDFHQAKSD